MNLSCTTRRTAQAALVAIACILTIPQLARCQSAEGGLPTIKAASFEGESTEVKLPGVVSDIDVGGGGRYLLMQFKSLRKIGVFDVNTLKIVGYITASPESVFAAGANKAIVIDPDKSIVSRWDIATQKRELTQSANLTGTGGALMGSASSGPVMIGGRNALRGGIQAIDLNSLKIIKPEFVGRSGMSRGVTRSSRISANGKTITAWGGGSPTGLQTYYQVGSRWQSRYEHTSVGMLIPTPDGRHVLTQGGIFTKELQRVGQRSRGSYDSPLAVAATSGPFYMTIPFSRSSSRKSEPGKLYLIGESRPIGNVPGISVLKWDSRARSGSELAFDKRFYLIPDAKLVLAVSSSLDVITCTKFDPEEALAKTDINFLIVSSQPPQTLKAGSSLQYQIRARSRHEPITYSLDSRPTGMKVSKTGLITWQTSTNSPTESDVIVSLSDQNDQQIFHTFRLNVDGATGKFVANSKGAKDGPQAPMVESTKFTGAKREVELPGVVSKIVPGGNGRYLLLHFRELKKIGVFDVSKAKVLKYVPAIDDQTIVTAGRDKFVLFSVTQGVISRWNFATQERELTKTSPFGGPIQHAAMGSNSQGPILLRWSAKTDALANCQFEFLDLETLDRSEVKLKRNYHTSYRDHTPIAAAANGNIYAAPSLGTVSIIGTTAELKGSSISAGAKLPSADGRYFLSHNGLYNQALQKVGGQQSFRASVPAVSGNYFLSFDSGTKLYMFGESRPLLSLPDIKLAVKNSYTRSPAVFGNVHFIPDANVVSVLRADRQGLILHRLNIDEALESSGVDYLLVTSVPNGKTQSGEKFQYPIRVKSKHGGLKFNLDSAPEGMTVSEKGVITWTVPKEPEAADLKVIVSVKDAEGQEAFHTFGIEITDAAERIAARIEARRKVDAEKAMQEQLKLAKARRAERIKKRAMEPSKVAPPGRQPVPTEPTSTTAARVWSDASGSHKVTARFVKIINMTSVVLLDESGARKTIELRSLSSADIFRAVELELQRRKDPSDLGSPFRDAASDAMVSAGGVDVTAVVEKRITEFIKIVDTETPVKSLLPALFHPDQIDKLIAKDQTRRNGSGQQLTRRSLLMLLYSLDASTARMTAPDRIAFKGSPVVFRLAKGKWYFANL